MPGYLIKAANFVAEISNDEELKHLAGVETIKKDTLICPLPGKEWIEAKKLPVLRTFWGLNAGTVPPPIQMNAKTPVAPVKTKLPPRLETVVDSIPRFPETEENSTLEDHDDIPTEIPETPHDGVSKRAYQSIASDILGIVEDPSEIMDMNAISRAAESSLTFEIDKIQELTSTHTWHEPQPEIALIQADPQNIDNVQDLDPNVLSIEPDAENEVQEIVDCFIEEAPADSDIPHTHQAHLSEDTPDAVSADSQLENAQNKLEETTTQAMQAPDFSAQKQNNPQTTTPQDTNLENLETLNPVPKTSEQFKPHTIAHDDYVEAAPHEPTYIIETQAIEDLQNAKVEPSHVIPEDEIPIDIEIDEDNRKIEDADDQTTALGSARDPEQIFDDILKNIPTPPPSPSTESPEESKGQNWRDSVSADMFVLDSVPDDLMQFADLLEEDFEPGDKTQISPSPVHVHSTDASRKHNTAKGCNSTEKQDTIKPFRAAEKPSKSETPVVEFADEQAPTNARFKLDSQDSSAPISPSSAPISPSSNEDIRKLEEANTGAWKSKEQTAAAQEILAGQSLSHSLAQELKAAKAAVEAAKAAAEQTGNFDASIFDPMMQLVHILEDAQAQSNSQISAQELATTHQNNNVPPDILDVPQDFLDENPSEMFKFRNRKDLLQQLEDSARLERAQKAFEAAPTLRKKPESSTAEKDNLAFLEEESHSDKLKVRGRSELRRMLAAEARAAEMDSIHAMSMVSTEDYTDNKNGQDQLRSLFEKEGELHLFLANNIKKKESQIELAPVEPEAPQEPNKEHSITDDLPRRNAHAVAIAKPREAEPTVITGKVVPQTPTPTSFNDRFFEDKLVEGETPVAQFDTFFLTTQRIIYIEGNHKHIRTYESHDIENVEWVKISDDQNNKLLILNGILVCIFGVLYIAMHEMQKEYDYVFLTLAIFCLVLLPLLWIVSTKKTVKICLSDHVILKSNVAITSMNNNKAINFITHVKNASLKRKNALHLS